MNFLGLNVITIIATVIISMGVAAQADPTPQQDAAVGYIAQNPKVVTNISGTLTTQPDGTNTYVASAVFSFDCSGGANTECQLCFLSTLTKRDFTDPTLRTYNDSQVGACSSAGNQTTVTSTSTNLNPNIAYIVAIAATVWNGLGPCEADGRAFPLRTSIEIDPISPP